MWGLQSGTGEYPHTHLRSMSYGNCRAEERPLPMKKSGSDPLLCVAVTYTVSSPYLSISHYSGSLPTNEVMFHVPKFRPMPCKTWLPPPHCYFGLSPTRSCGWPSHQALTCGHHLQDWLQGWWVPATQTEQGVVVPINRPSSLISVHQGWSHQEHYIPCDIALRFTKLHNQDFVLIHKGNFKNNTKCTYTGLKIFNASKPVFFLTCSLLHHIMPN